MKRSTKRLLGITAASALAIAAAGTVLAHGGPGGPQGYGPNGMMGGPGGMRGPMMGGGQPGYGMPRGEAAGQPPMMGGAGMPGRGGPAGMMGGPGRMGGPGGMHGPMMGGPGKDRGMGGPGMMMGGDPQAFADRHLARMKSELGITAEQEPAWNEFESVVRERMAMMGGHRQMMSAGAFPGADQRMAMHRDGMARMQAVRTAGQRLYQALTPEQQARVGNMMGF